MGVAIRKGSCSPGILTVVSANDGLNRLVVGLDEERALRALGMQETLVADLSGQEHEWSLAAFAGIDGGGRSDASGTLRSWERICRRCGQRPTGYQPSRLNASWWVQASRPVRM
jgi:hypothetical protein